MATLINTAVSVQRSAAPFLAIGILSAPVYVDRRALLRATWLRHPNIGHTVTAHFVVRSKGAPELLLKQFDYEDRKYHDLVLLPEVRWNESRLRGPILSLIGWFAAASSMAIFRTVKYIAKVDDDSYVHTVAMERVLRHAFADLPHERVYSGVLTYFNWFTKLFDRGGFGWNCALTPIKHVPVNPCEPCFLVDLACAMCAVNQAIGYTFNCLNESIIAQACGRDDCGGCVGPFPFASGFWIILSRTLASELASSRGVHGDLTVLEAMTHPITHLGREHRVIFEDIWLGSMVSRMAMPLRPLSIVSLTRNLVSDLDHSRWQSKILTR